MADNRAPGSSRGPIQVRRLVLLGLVLVVVVAVAAFAAYRFAGAGAAQTSPTPTVAIPESMSLVAQFNGSGDATTDSFTVAEGWQISWQTTGESFHFAIAGDRDYGTVIRQEGPGTGITSPVGHGKFYLKVTAKGPWSVQILQPT